MTHNPSAAEARSRTVITAHKVAAQHDSTKNTWSGEERSKKDTTFIYLYLAANDGIVREN